LFTWEREMPEANESRPVVERVKVFDRVLDAGAAALLLAGTGMFLFARYSLTSLANGTYMVPKGVTFVSRADLHSAQSQTGLWLAAAGLLMSLVATASHWRRKG
jgi:hypothetical protein